jgi:aryl-alcohol dehydrogenase-like predicted oxidoreductase
MKIGLGTVEFAAKTGKHALQVTLDEAARILEIAQRAGITLLDTAAQAGNSEEVLGECLPKQHAFRIVAKTPSVPAGGFTAHQADQVEIALHDSLSNLRQDRLYALMTGHEDGLFTEYGDKLYKRMESLKAQGLIEKIGVSVTHAYQIDRVLAQCKPNILQVPLNVLDQRLIMSGHLQRLSQQGIEIHARDIFLQGVLLDPTHLHPWFWPIRKRMDAYHQALIEEGFTPLEGALNVVASRPDVDVALVGVNSAEQLREVIAAVQPGFPTDRFAAFACPEEKYIDPHQWNLYE